MPLLMCPNCDASMQNVNRGGVELDMCPSCRGVWLDRGELEKLLSEAKSDRAAEEGARQKFDREVEAFHRDPDDWKRKHAYDERERRYRYDDDDYYKHRKKKKGFDLFDIFD